MSVQKALAAPFAADEVRFKPASVSGSRARAVCYLDARAVMDRLDEVFGVGGWQTAYRELPDGVVCRLRVKTAEGWCEHEDVGSYSEQPDDGDKLKAAFSDALKRAAVHVGVGRYLYRLPQFWVDYDPKKKQIVKPPELPAWALPPKLDAAKAALPPGAVKPASELPASRLTPPEREGLLTLMNNARGATDWADFQRDFSDAFGCERWDLIDPAKLPAARWILEAVRSGEVSPEFSKYLAKRAADAGADGPKFLAAFGAKSFAEFPAKSLVRALAQLERKKARAA